KENPNLYWSNRIAYFDIEEAAESELAVPTRLHVIPIQTEVLWQFSKATFSPFVALGLLGMFQFQRGAEAVQSSEVAGLWTGRIGINWEFKSFLESPLGLSASLQGQENWVERDEAWTGSGFDLSLSM